jgi:phosphatidyl-myo-inositol dimannoside synthase
VSTPIPPAPQQQPGPPPARGAARPGGVLLVSQVFPPAVGGSGMLLENIYTRVNLPVTVLTDRETCRGTEETRGPLTMRRIDLRGDLWGLLNRRALMQHVRVARTIRRLAAPPAVVHCGRAQPEGVAALLAAAAPGGPRYVFWAHGEEISAAQTSRELRWIMRRVYAGAALAIANSRNTAAMLEAAGMPRAKIEVVYPGVDARRFSAEVDGAALRQQLAPDGELLLVTVGRVERRKGHDLALAALAAARHRLPPFRYAIVGGGGERARLEAMAVEYGIADRVVFTGEVSAGDLPRYFAACDIFVHPNRVVDRSDFEGFGLVFLEAAACGKPAIGGATGGVTEAVQDGITGLLVSGTDAEELAGVIERLARSPELRARLGQAGRDRVRDFFTWETAARRVEAVHARVLGSRE